MLNNPSARRQHWKVFHGIRSKYLWDTRLRTRLTNIFLRLTNSLPN